MRDILAPQNTHDLNAACVNQIVDRVTEVNRPSQPRVDMLHRRRKLRIAGDLLESNHQALIIAIRLFETEPLNAELVESVKIPDGLFTQPVTDRGSPFASLHRNVLLRAFVGLSHYQRLPEWRP